MAEEKWIHKGAAVPVLESAGPMGQLLLHRVRGHEDKILLVDGESGEEVSRAQLLARSVSVALELQQRGVRPGDVVSAALDNGPDTVCAMLGIMYIGGVSAPLNPDMHQDDLRHLVQLLEPAMVLCAPRAAERFRATLPPGAQLVVAQRGEADWDAFFQRPEDDVARFQAHAAADPEDTFCIVPSSGTTGPPKGVMLCHRNWQVFIQSAAVAARHLPPADKSKEVAIQVTYNFWMSGFFTIILNVVSGAQMVIYRHYDVDVVLAGVQKYKATTLMLAPAYVSAIAKHADVERYDTSSLQSVSFSGAALSPALQQLAGKRLGSGVTRLYGTTESLLVVLPGPLSREKPATIGKVALNVSLKIVDKDTGRILGPNTEGELCLKSRMTFTGYYKNPVATEETVDKEGWVHTGDAAYFDEDGYFYIVDRYKELIKFRGNLMYPAEVENILTAHEGVKDAAVVGIEHDEDQEHPVGFVVLQEGHDVPKEELLQLLRGQLPEYKQLHGGLHYVTEIPRSATAKIKRRELRQLARILREEGRRKL